MIGASLAVLITTIILIIFLVDPKVNTAPPEQVTWVDIYPANRTDAEIIAQQKIDGPIEAKAKADQEKREAEVRASFKKVDDKLKKFGL